MLTTETPTMEQMAESLLIVDDPAEEVAADEPELEAVDDEPQADTAEDDVSENEDESEEETDVPDQPKLYKVKVDGKEIEVTEEELTRGYSGQQYIQKGMQEVAAAKKAIEAEAKALRDAQELIAGFVQKVQTEGLKAAPQPPNPELANTDPVGYIQERARYEAEVNAYNAQMQQLQSLDAQRQQMTQKQQAEYLAEQQRILTERIPDFSDAAKAGEIRQKLVKVGREAYGFSADELSSIMDARAVQVLHDAMKWQEFQASKAKATQPKAPPSVKPAARRPEPQQLARSKQLDQLKKSGSLRDAVDLLLVRKG